MRTLALLGMAVILAGFFFQCCPSTTSEAPSIQPPEEQPTQPSGEPPADQTAAPPPASPTPIALPTDTPTPIPRPEPQHFSGQGQQVSPVFDLAPGLALFHITHDGDANLAITLLDQEGEWVELLVNEIGPFDGAKAVGIESPGPHIVDVTADGNWAITVEQPAIPAEAPSPPLSFSGHAQQVSPLFSLAEGLATFHMTHDGSANFAILLLDSEGQWVELLVNEIGAFDGGKAVGVGNTGIHILDISADGNWSVTIEQ